MKKIVVIGGGTMGLDIAQVFARNGYDVVVRDIKDEIIQASEARLNKGLDKLVSKGKLDEAKKAEILSHMSFTTELAAAADADLVVEAAIENLGEWLKRKTGSEGDNEFTNAFVSASLTVCIGAMAIVGSIQDGLLGDWSTLALKGALDCIIVCTMTASLGRGCIFSALPVAVFQGTITLFAGALSPIMTTAALDSLSLVGSMLIFCVGVNVIGPQTFRTANMLPSVVVAVIYALLF